MVYGMKKGGKATRRWAAQRVLASALALALFMATLVAWVPMLSACGPASGGGTQEQATSAGGEQAEATTAGAAETPGAAEQSKQPETIEEWMALDAQTPITMTITMQSDDPPPEDASILAEFAKRTGVHFVVNGIPGDPHEKLSMMLAAGNLTDIMVIPPDQLLNQYMQSDQIVDIKPLLQEYAPTVWELFNLEINNNVADMFTLEDGRMLYFTSDLDLAWADDDVRYEDPNDPNGYKWLPWGESLYVLYPALDEAFGEKITSIDQWHEAAQSFQALYPEKYAVTTHNKNGSDTLMGFAQIYGYKVSIVSDVPFYSKDGGTTYEHVLRMPQALQGLQFMNGLYLDGLMDPEGPLQNTDAFTEKLSAGRAFSFLGTWAQIYTANDALGSAAETELWTYIPQRVVAEGVTQRYEGNLAYIGENCTMVTTSCASPERFARFLEYLFTDEGLVLNGWGFEGEDYVIREDGVRDVSLEIDQENRDNPDLRAGRGHNLFFYIVDMPFHLRDKKSAALSWYAPLYMEEADDGYTSAAEVVEDTKYNWYKDFTGGYYRDLALEGITLPENSAEAVTAAKLVTPLEDLVAKAILAGSAQEVEQLYNEAIAQFELDGLAALEAYVQGAIDKNRE